MDLQRELEVIRRARLRAQPGPYHRDAWKGVRLVGSGPRFDRADADSPTLEPYARTALLDELPALDSVLRSIPGRITCARVMFVAPGGVVDAHVDGWHVPEAGLARLQLPIVSPTSAACVVEGYPVPWAEGDLWYVDFSRPHHVTNASDKERSNLIVDVEATYALRALGAGEAVLARLHVGPPIVTLTQCELTRLECRLRGPMPCLVSAITDWRVRVIGAEIALVADDGGQEMALAILEPYGPRCLHVRGTPPGFTLEYEQPGTRARVYYRCRGMGPKRSDAMHELEIVEL